MLYTLWMCEHMNELKGKSFGIFFVTLSKTVVSVFPWVNVSRSAIILSKKGTNSWSFSYLIYYGKLCWMNFKN